MAMTTDAIKNAYINAQSSNMSADDAAQAIAQAIIDTVQTLTLTYSTGLISGSPGDPVTGAMTSVLVS